MSTKSTRPNIDLYQTVTDSLIASLEAGADGNAWRAPWHSAGGLGLPENVVSHKAYRGVNVFILWSAQLDAGYDSPLWATYKQWKLKGAQVRKGEHGTRIFLWKPFEKKADDGETHKALYATSFTVFNVAQVDGYEVPAPVERTDFEVIEHARAFFAKLGANVRHGGDRAYYAPVIDTIQLPHPEQFKSNVDYYATSAHEHTHWTGHKDRCDRDLKNRFGSHEYAAEELVAEIGSAYVCAHLGITNEPRPDHAQYLANWLELLRSDPKAIVTAASKAQQAVDYLLKLAGETVDTVEEHEEVAA